MPIFDDQNLLLARQAIQGLQTQLHFLKESERRFVRQMNQVMACLTSVMNVAEESDKAFLLQAMTHYQAVSDDVGFWTKRMPDTDDHRLVPSFLQQMHEEITNPDSEWQEQSRHCHWLFYYERDLNALVAKYPETASGIQTLLQKPFAQLSRPALFANGCLLSLQHISRIEWARDAMSIAEDIRRISTSFVSESRRVRAANQPVIEQMKPAPIATLTQTTHQPKVSKVTPVIPSVSAAVIDDEQTSERLSLVDILNANAVAFYDRDYSRIKPWIPDDPIVDGIVVMEDEPDELLESESEAEEGTITENYQDAPLQPQLAPEAVEMAAINHEMEGYQGLSLESESEAEEGTITENYQDAPLRPQLAPEAVEMVAINHEMEGYQDLSLESESEAEEGTITENYQDALLRPQLTPEAVEIAAIDEDDVFTPTQNNIANQQLQTLKHTIEAAIARNQCPVNGGFFAGTVINWNNSQKRVPAHVAWSLTQIERAENNPANARQICEHILKQTFQVVRNKSFYRDNRTTALYTNIWNNMPINVLASLDLVRAAIENKPNTYWGTLIDHKPTTVVEMEAILNNPNLQNSDKLRQLMSLNAQAEESNGNWFKHRSANTQRFYTSLWQCLVFDEPRPAANLQI